MYQLTKLCSDNPDLVPFKVTVQNDHRGRRSVSFTKTVEISIYGITITLSRDYPNKVLVSIWALRQKKANLLKQLGALFTLCSKHMCFFGVGGCLFT